MNVHINQVSQLVDGIILAPKQVLPAMSRAVIRAIINSTNKSDFGRLTILLKKAAESAPEHQEYLHALIDVINGAAIVQSE